MLSECLLFTGLGTQQSTGNVAAVIVEPEASWKDRQWASTQWWEVQLHDKSRMLWEVSFHRRGSLAFQLEMKEKPEPSEP